MREQGKFPIEHSAGAKASDSGCHAATKFNIETWLRAVGCIEVADRNFRSGREALLLRNTAEFSPCVENFCNLSLLFEFNRDRFGVAVFNCDSVALRAHFEWGEIYPGSV